MGPWALGAHTWRSEGTATEPYPNRAPCSPARPAVLLYNQPSQANRTALGGRSGPLLPTGLMVDAEQRQEAPSLQGARRDSDPRGGGCALHPARGALVKSLPCSGLSFPTYTANEEAGGIRQWSRRPGRTSRHPAHQAGLWRRCTEGKRAFPPSSPPAEGIRVCRVPGPKPPLLSPPRCAPSVTARISRPLSGHPSLRSPPALTW